MTDTQTITDLGIFDKNVQASVYAIYNHTRTRGGAAVLETLFRYPLSDAGSINKRNETISYFATQPIRFPFPPELLDAAEQYLSERDERTRLSTEQQSLGQKISHLVAEDTTHKQILRGIMALLTLLQTLRDFLQADDIQQCQAYTAERNAALTLLSNPDLAPLLGTHQRKLAPEQAANYDRILRFRCHTAIRKLLEHIYYLDVYISVGQVSQERGYTFATATGEGNALLHLEGVKHPAITGAKGNDLHMDSENNVLFLTGANMAGKSTFMKSVAIAMYVAHAGLPVAADRMQFSVRDGLLSTINLPDNLGMGASHFYAEVLRVKKVAQALSEGKRLFVLFDELFRGTNVKDAHEGTVAVLENFAGNADSMFIVSTHIIEAGAVLQARSRHIQYRFLPTKMQGHTPVYTYLLEEGITADRHGMLIIRNEAILEMLNSKK